MRLRNNYVYGVGNKGLTWHEHQDLHTMKLISRSIHGTKYGDIPHRGGIHIVKQQEAQALMNAMRQLNGGN